MVITSCSRFTSLTRNKTGLIVGSAEDTLCQTLWDQMESISSPAKCRLSAYNLSIYLTSNFVHDAALYLARCYSMVNACLSVQATYSTAH